MDVSTDAGSGIFSMTENMADVRSVTVDCVSENAWYGDSELIGGL